MYIHIYIYTYTHTNIYLSHTYICFQMSCAWTSNAKPPIADSQMRTPLQQAVEQPRQLFYDRDDTEWDGDGDEVRPLMYYTYIYIDI